MIGTLIHSQRKCKFNNYHDSHAFLISGDMVGNKADSVPHFMEFTITGRKKLYTPKRNRYKIMFDGNCPGEVNDR